MDTINSFIMNETLFEASQSNTVYLYQNIKIKLLKVNLHIKFNKKCIRNNIIPNYAKIKINDTSTAAKITISE